MTYSDKDAGKTDDDCGLNIFSHGTAVPSIRTQVFFWSITILGIAADLWTKEAVFEWLGERDSYSVIEGFLRLVTAVNAGAAFGIAHGRRYLLIGVSVTALIVILSVFYCSGKERRIIHTALAFFTAGICGNLYDRLFNAGLVRDFIDVIYWPGKHWPAFNIADSLLCIAVGLMIIAGLFTGQSGQTHAQRQIEGL